MRLYFSSRLKFLVAAITVLTIIRVILNIDFYTNRGVKIQNESELSENSTRVKIDLNADLMAFTEMIRKRRDKVSQQCQLWKGKEFIPKSHANLFYLEQKNILWCPVFKAASTNWMINFVELSKTKEQKKILPQITGKRKKKKFKPNPLNKAKEAVTLFKEFKDYLKTYEENKSLRSFLIVRHPFQRLVSAFRDKLERTHLKKYKNDYYYVKYGAEIVRKYRDQAITIFGEEVFSKENNYGAILPPTSAKSRVPSLPIFWEFVQFILDQESKSHLDEHWTPAYYHCGVCDIHYDAVIKFENLNTEEPLLERYLGIQNQVSFRRENENKVSQELSEEEVTKIYFESLSNEDVQRLYKLYEAEFLFFGYTFHFRNMTFPS